MAHVFAEGEPLNGNQQFALHGQPAFRLNLRRNSLRNSKPYTTLGREEAC